MAKKMNPWIVIAAVVVGVVLFMQYGGNLNLGGSNEASDAIGKDDIGNFVNAKIELYAQDKYEPSTSITAADENATVIKRNGGTIVTTGVLLNGGTTVPLIPGKQVDIAFGGDDEITADDYYADLVKYTGLPVDTAQDVVSQMCQIDAALTITVINDEGVEAANGAAAALAVGADDEADFKIRVQTGNNECYGNPKADGTNTLCFEFNDTAIETIVSDDLSSMGQPGTVDVTTAGNDVKCFALPLLGERADEEYRFTVEATGTEPTVAHNVSIQIDDIALFLNADNNEFEYGFEDEDSNALGAAVDTTNTLYIQ